MHRDICQWEVLTLKILKKDNLAKAVGDQSKGNSNLLRLQGATIIEITVKLSEMKIVNILTQVALWHGRINLFKYQQMLTQSFSD